MTKQHTVVVFGGTGFLGRRIVDRLLDCGFSPRVASRRPWHSRGIDREAVERISADVNNEQSVDEAIDGAYAVVNAVSLYLEGQGQTFRSVHIDAAARVARRAHCAGVRRFIHVSGIGADPHSRSAYVRSRGLGEIAVREAFSSAIVVRPAVMFGPDDSFVSSIENILRRSPLFPLFGSGETLLQPAHVEDVGKAISRELHRTLAYETYELGGPRVLPYRKVVDIVGERIGVRPRTVPVPFLAWYATALAAEFLPGSPLTRNQVELMEIDNVAAPDMPGFASLGIVPRDIATI